MIQKITSKKVELPPIYLVENEDDFKQLPKGLPYIVANKEELKFITIFLEFQVLYKSCLKTKLAVKWLDCLKKIGYGSNLKKYELESGGSYWESGSGSTSKLSVEDFIEDQYLVDFDKLAELKILPKWLDDLRSSVEANIIDEVLFDPTAFNKPMGLNIGAGVVAHNMKNLLILDVSSSMPNGVVTTITNLAKLMSKKFYADVIVTGGKSFFIDYEDVQNRDIVDIAREAGRSNEGEMFAAIVKEVKEYNTVISFGDDDNPISYGKFEVKDCNFEVETLYSLHTKTNSTNVTGYARCLVPKTTHIVKDWLHSINK